MIADCADCALLVSANMIVFTNAAMQSGNILRSHICLYVNVEPNILQSYTKSVEKPPYFGRLTQCNL